MKPILLSAPGLLLLLAASPAFAVNDTWDGGGADNNIGTALNWLDNSAPLSDLVNTNLFFDGVVRLTPNFSAPFSVDSITFNNNAATNGFVFFGAALNVGARGIVNKDEDAQTFSNAVDFGGVATSPINAASGALALNSAVTLPTTTLSLVGGSAITFGSTIAGTGAITKISAGAFTFNATGTAIGADFNLNAGVTTLTATGTTQTFLSTSTIAVGASGTFNINENTILDGGAQLTRASGSTVSIASGKTLRIQAGSDFIATDGQTLSGGNVTVTGAGSTLQSVGSSAFGISVVSGSTLAVQSGGGVNVFGFMNVGGNGTLTVDGAGSSVVATANGSIWGNGAGTANVILANNATATLAYLRVGSFPGTTAVAQVLSGADVVGSGLYLGADFSGPSGGTGTLTIDGAGSTWSNSNGNSNVHIIGTASASSGILNVQNGGTFTTGNVLTTVNATGRINLTGGTFNATGNLTLTGTGAQLNADAAGTLTVAAGKTFSILNGADAVFTDLYATDGSNVTLNGSGSTLQTGFNFYDIGGSTVLVEAGASLISGAGLHVGTNGSGILTVNGSTVSAASLSLWAGASSTANVSFANNATGTLAGVDIANGPSVGSAGTAQVLTGADVTSGSLNIGSNGTAVNSGSLNVDGAGSTWTQTGASAFTLGGAANSTGTLSVSNGGAFTSGTGAFTVRALGTLNLSGGTLTVNGALSNSGTLSFTAGTLNLLGANNLAVGTGGLLGQNLTLLSDRTVNVANTTTIDFTRTLTLNGGTLRTGVLVNNGTLDFPKGILGITGAGGFNIGTGVLGSNVTLGTGANLEVTNTTTVASGALLRVNGGSFSGSTITNDGTLDHRDGTLAFTGTFTNNSAGRVFLSGIAAPAGNISNAGRVTLQNGIGILGGAGTLTNTGILTGDGTIARPVTNSTAGIIRGEAGKVLSFAGSFAANNGTLSLLGGMLEFTNGITNAVSGFISGEGFLVTGGLTNSGTAAFIGDTGVLGDVTNASGGRIVTSGGAVTVLYDDLVHNGAEIRTGSGSRTVILGAATGAGPYTGTGLVQFEGDLRPGNSPATVNFGGDVALSSTSALTMELGGLTKGTQYDSLAITGSLSAAGTLTLTLVNGFTPHAGDTFDLFDAAVTTGTFGTLALPALPAGLTWDSTQLYTTGVITVSSTTGLTFAQWAATVLGDPAATPTGDHDFDGYDNATEFALGLFPPQPGTVLPNGGFHTYGDGTSLRLHFTRPLDRTGVTLKIQASNDLTTWTDLATSVNSAPFTGPGFVSENRAHPLSDPGLVEIRDPSTTNTSSRRQMRVLVTIAP